MFIKTDNSIVEDDVNIGEGTKIWYFSHICKGAKLGNNVNIGDHCYVGKGVMIGNDVKIANNVSVYPGTIIKDGVFIGNNVSFTNVRKPRAKKKSKECLDTIVDEGVTIGANATILGGVRIGKDAIIAEGSVVIGDLPANSFSAGNPAKIKKFIKDENN